jgi:hypothetical protein
VGLENSSGLENNDTHLRANACRCFENNDTHLRANVCRCFENNDTHLRANVCRVLQSRVVFQAYYKSSCLPYNSKIYLSVAKSIMLFPRQYDQQTLQAAVN